MSGLQNNFWTTYRRYSELVDERYNQLVDERKNRKSFKMGTIAHPLSSLIRDNIITSLEDFNPALSALIMERNTTFIGENDLLLRAMQETLLLLFT